MEIDKNGYILPDLITIIKLYEAELQKKYGSDYHIKPDEIIENIVIACGLTEINLQDNIEYICEQYNPEGCSGDFQDALYERLGVKRLEAEPTILTKKITGTAGYTAQANTITIRNLQNSCEFINSNSFTIDDSGNADVNFEANTKGAISVNPDDEFQIVDAPNEITGISDEPASDIALGRYRETDDEFRQRFKSSKAMNSKATRNANDANLTKYVDNIAFLKIIDKKSDNTFAPGTLEIIAKHNTTDEIFAQAVFDTVADGVNYIGNTSKIAKDEFGEDVIIKFEKAVEPEIYINGSIKVKDGYYANNVITNAKQNILDYIQKRVFGLQSIIYATEFIVPILETDGVEAVLDISVKKGEDGSFVESISLAKNEAPDFAPERITLNENA